MHVSSNGYSASQSHAVLCTYHYRATRASFRFNVKPDYTYLNISYMPYFLFILFKDQEDAEIHVYFLELH